MKMKTLLSTLALLLFATASQAADLYFSARFAYRADYQHGIGRASMEMTGSPGYVVVTTDKNTCDTNGCYLVGFKGDLSGTLFRLTKISETENLVKYVGEVVPFTSIAKENLDPEYLHDIEMTKIFVEADISPEQIQGGSYKGDVMAMRIAKTVVLTVVQGNQRTQHILKKK